MLFLCYIYGFNTVDKIQSEAAQKNLNGYS
jgi:hypothetical protein